MNRAIGLFVARGWANVCALASLLAIGQGLDPAAFGFYAVASSAVLLPQTLVGAGFAEHVISRDPERRDEHLAFWCTAAFGFTGAVLAALAAAGLYGLGAPSPMPLLVLCLAPLPAMWSLAAISEAALVRDNRGGPLAATLIASETVGLVVMFAALWQGAGVFALAMSRVANLVVTLAGYSTLARVRIIGPIDLNRVRALWRFAAGIMGARMVTWADGYGVDLALAAVLNPQGVGLYRMGGRVVGAPASVFIQSVGQAQLAYLGERLAAAPRRLGSAMLRAARLHYALATPLFVLLCVCAGDLVDIVFDDQWSGAAPVLALLAVGALPTIAYTIGVSALVAVGRSGRLVGFQVAALGCTLGGLLIGAALSGPTGAAIGKTIGSTLSAVIVLSAVRELSSADRRRVLGAIAAIALAAFACAGAALLGSVVIPRPEGAVLGLARIAAIGVIGLAAYATALPLAAPGAFAQLRFVARRKLSERRRARRAAIMEPAE